MRDQFSKATIVEIAKGSGYRCSNPACRRPTVAANAAQDGAISIGVAAHIRAASPGGPRYDPSQSEAARRGRENGLWLCQTCARIVDVDPDDHPTSLLHEWKRDAQARALRELLAPSGHVGQVGEGSSDELCESEGADRIATSFDKVRAAARRDFETYEREHGWSGKQVELTLRLHDRDGSRLPGGGAAPDFTLGRLPSILETSADIAIVAQPGTGKTTTLLQLGRKLLDDGRLVPIFFGLGEWGAEPRGLVESLRRRRAYADVSAAEIQELADHGRLALLLDGWNELDLPSRGRLRTELNRIRRESPRLRVVATTRLQALDVPLAGPRIDIAPLSEDQQAAIARASSDAAGEAVVDRAWRTPGIRGLVTVPLYLKALLSNAVQGSLPTSKDGVLRLFVRQHEHALEHAEPLQQDLLGCQTSILGVLASSLNDAGTTALAEADARRIATDAFDRLRREGQIGQAPEVSRALELLVGHHVLVRFGESDVTIAFQHQQLQEWYAAGEVCDLMRRAWRGDDGAQVRLRAGVFDRPFWEESVLFACERLSDEAGGPACVANAVTLALTVDPMLAAEMIFRATEEVWSLVAEGVSAFVERWHRPGVVDRAVRFMIMTGRPEFARHVWALASSGDSQLQLPTLQAAPHFRPSVLGPDLVDRISRLPERIREHLLALMASESGFEGMDLATELAREDPSPDIQVEVFQALHHRRADRHVARLVEGAHERTLSILAERGYAEEVGDPGAAARLRQARDKALAELPDAVARLRVLVAETSIGADRLTEISAAVADPGLDLGDRLCRTLLHLVGERASSALSEGLLRRLEIGLEVPSYASDHLRHAASIDEGRIPALALDVGREHGKEALVAAGLAGPRTVARLVDAYLACSERLSHDPRDAALAETERRLHDRSSATRADHLLSAVIARGGSVDPARAVALAGLVTSHGDHEERRRPIVLDDASRRRIVASVRAWTEIVVQAPDGNRYHLAEIARCIGRLGDCDLVTELTTLLAEDLARWRAARERFSAARRRGDALVVSDAAMSYGNQYADAFISVGGPRVAEIASGFLEDRLFGVEAARILKAVSEKRLDASDHERRRSWPDFDGVAEARLRRDRSEKPASTAAERIFEAVARLSAPETDEEGQDLAIRLACVAMSMPHREHDELVSRVLALPRPVTAKRNLFAAVALAGYVIDARPVLGAINGWLVEADRDASTAWHKRQNTWEIEAWLELLPFTDRPATIISEFGRVGAFYGGWRHGWDRVLAAVTAAPGDDGEDLMTAFARAHPTLRDGWGWLRAFGSRGRASSALRFVDLCIDGTLDPGDWRAGREVAELTERFPELRAELRARFETGGERARALLRDYLAEHAEPVDLLLMIDDYSAAGRNADHDLGRAVEAVTLHHRPIAGSPNTYTVHPASVGALRRLLFERGRRDDVAAKLARMCLEQIDRLRDEHGIAEDDPRHPDVMSEAPWPLEIAAAPGAPDVGGRSNGATSVLGR